MRRFLLFGAIAAVLFTGCAQQQPGPGVSESLAEQRASEISDLHYNIAFNIPASPDSSITAKETIDFEYSGHGPVVLDFKPSGDPLYAVSVGGKMVGTQFADEHILVPARCGHVNIEILFTAGDQSLNRRSNFLYTLLVPDRARTLFPCFDQPDLKARYTLSLNIPDSWCAVSNTKESGEEPTEPGYKKVSFSETEPLSTYLFSFVAGEFSKITEECDGRSVTMYHRETDPAKIAQAGDVFDLVFSALNYMEEYTGVPYPFAKYDFVVIPDFQYGGMEHTGATLYNDRRIFLGERPTTGELLDRAALISHETAHMWFGDYVTMRWFDDVWTKEVFANWFAAQMARPAFPEINHTLGDLNTLFAPSYSEDRTLGSNAIQRPLGNLSDAGLIYCNIIYDKAPVVMDKLVRRMGPEAFREGIREYLGKYGYANASWDDLVEILDHKADFDVSEWSRVWIKEKGMPIYAASPKGNVLTITQIDPFQGGNVWQQHLQYTVISAKQETAVLDFDFSNSDSLSVAAPFNIEYCLPNTDGLGYGCFLTDKIDAEYVMRNYLSLEPTARMSLLMTLYENVWRHNLNAASFTDWASQALFFETDPIIFASLLSYAVSAAGMTDSGDNILEQSLFELAADTSMPHEMRLQAFRNVTSVAKSDEIWDNLFATWESMKPFDGLTLGESDYTTLAYRLMVHYPDLSEYIRDTQRARIANPDRLETFDFVSLACQERKEDRDAFFRSLSDPSRRRPESRVLTALSLLNSKDYQPESIQYIRPALEMLEDIQKTGDIFFPSSWAKTLLRNYTTPEAAAEVQAFINGHPDLNPLLMTKVRQAAGYLLQ